MDFVCMFFHSSVPQTLVAPAAACSAHTDSEQTNVTWYYAAIGCVPHFISRCLFEPSCKYLFLTCALVYSPFRSHFFQSFDFAFVRQNKVLLKEERDV